MKKIVLIMFCLMMLLLFSACNQEGDSMGETELKLCDHNFVDGTCKKCGALKPTEGLEYTLNEDGQSYTLTRGWIKTPYDYRVVIADVYEGLPVTAIGDGAFYKGNGMDNFNLTEVVISNTVTTIGSLAFGYCVGLTKINIPDSVTSIGSSAFSGCDGLTNVKIPDSVTSIGSSAFSGCDSLTSISLGNSLTDIGSGAFCGCDALATIYWSKKAVTVGGEAFTYCDNLKNIYIANIESWCASDFKFSNSQGNNSVTNPLSRGAKLYLNEKLVTDLVIPEGVTKIGEYAFYGYDELTSISLPDSLMSVGSYAFDGCSNLNYKRYDTAYYLGNDENPYLCLAKTTDIGISGCNIHKDTKIIADDAFEWCDDLESITLPDGLRSIGDSAFSYCGITGIVIPDTVTYIGNGAFSSCKNLAAVTLPAGLTAISNSMFVLCENLKNITIPDKVVTIGSSAFSSSGLQEIVIPEGVTGIGQNAFATDTLKTVTLPTTLVNIGDYAFSSNQTWNSSGPDRVNISSLEAWCGIAFANNKANPLWDGATLYLNGEEVTELVIPEGITSIGNYAFYGSKITSITIPASVTSIGDQAFSSCSKLATITFAGTLEQWYAVSLGASWNASAPTKKIICSDGEANL